MVRILLFSFIFLLYTTNISIAQTTAIQPDESPIFGNCNAKKSKKEIYDCSITNLTMYLNTALRYPMEAREANIQGRVKVQFTIDSLGQVGNAKLVNDIGSKCGEEALRVVMAMPHWQPAKYKGKPVTMYMTMPINFVLSDDENTEDLSFRWGTFQGENITMEQLRDQCKTPIMILDIHGNTIPMVSLMMECNLGKRQKEAGSNGVINEEMQNILRKAKPGSIILFHILIERNAKIVQLEKKFVVGGK
jgi:TonB family protein